MRWLMRRTMRPCARSIMGQPRHHMSSKPRKSVPLLSLADGDVHYSFRSQQRTGSGEGVPLVLLGGTSQTIASFVAHAGAFAKGRPLLQYETRGQGRHTSLPLTDCSLAQQVRDFDAIMDEMASGPHALEGPVDLCGFSFGGRLALAIAATVPHRVRRLVVTGVPAQRGAQGRVILKSWQGVLESGNLEAWVYQSIADGHSRAFLDRWEDKLPIWARAAASMNRAEAIAAIVSQTHVEDEADPFHTMTLARSLAAQNAEAFFIARAISLAAFVFEVVVRSESSRPPRSHQVRRLAEVGGWECEIIDECGHSAPIDQAEKWRASVLRFLDQGR